MLKNKVPFFSSDLKSYDCVLICTVLRSVDLGADADADTPTHEKPQKTLESVTETEMATQILTNDPIDTSPPYV